jgi:hypothetical protein
MMTAAHALGAEQKAMPVIGFLSGASPAPTAPYLAAFLQGLSETGYIEGRNVTIEYRWAEDRYDRLPALAADLVARKVRSTRRHASGTGCEKRNRDDPDRFWRRRPGRAGPGRLARDDDPGPGNQLGKHLDELGRQLQLKAADAGEVAARPGETGVPVVVTFVGLTAAAPGGLFSALLVTSNNPVAEHIIIQNAQQANKRRV